MSFQSKIRPALKKGDIILAGLVIAVSLAWFALSFAGSGNGLKMEIYLDGQLQVSRELSDVADGEYFTVGSCEIYASRDGVKFISSDCEDSLCIKRGLMSRRGDSMACVPERVVVVIKGNEKTEADIVAY